VRAVAHRGEPANKESNTQANNAISIKDVLMEWHDSTNRAIFRASLERRYSELRRLKVIVEQQGAEDH